MIQRTETIDQRAVDWMPWHWCNLARNPFGELTREERIDVAVVDVDEIAGRVVSDHTAVQLMGECGRGKTTRMLVLHRELPDSSYVYLPQDEPCPTIAVGRPVLIDEAQRLPRRVRKQVFGSRLPLVLATHRDLTRPLRRAGYKVHTQEIGLANDSSLVCRLMNRRIEASRIDVNRAAPKLTIHDAETLVSRFGSDVRAMESYLYDVVQSQVFRTHPKRRCEAEPNHGEMRFID
ncbi:MAG: hypothetical protein HKN47_11345 [Pirellulaceae bacterium]|nr:hypothetical protein [Pirellulaceae bacterium]